ncbi:hypothetical protein DFH08DRAFT_899596 [Mycena albidolilacea]|uniref:SAP domain-containing protein n=1 Tax=Mycena albidolilacea TaxID=1033008 RepID=A0AAD6Z5N2_9AGAR|nr:hypothetical protein DFH08DRAFT_899596 [Mycena albidolilacea]
MAAAAVSQSGVAADKDTFTFPTKDGGSEERSLDGKTQDQLKEMCRQYGLGVSGNKTILKTRLGDFSAKFCNDPASCDLQPVKHRSHKGPRDGVKKSQAKQSVTRRAAIIDTERVTERSKDNRTSDEIKDLLSWARRTQARLPYRPPTETTQPQAITIPETMQPETVPVPQVSRQVSLSDHSLQDRVQTIESQLAVFTTAVTTGFRPGIYQSSVQASASVPFLAYPDVRANDGIYNFSTGDFETDNLLFNIPSDASRSHSSDSQNLHISQRFAAVLPLPIQADISDSLSSTYPPAPPRDASLSVPAKAVANEPTRSIKLGDGTVVSITAEEVEKLSVPATSFAEDIERLNQMWDDTSPHWKEDSVVKIDGRSIALVYWPNLFKKTGLWSAHKSNWTEWKFLIEHYRSQDGGKMSYTAICGQLRHSRKNSDEELAERARLEYGENFVVKFSYRCSKTNSRKVMTKPSAIAKEYKRLSTL